MAGGQQAVGGYNISHLRHLGTTMMPTGAYAMAHATLVGHSNVQSALEAILHM